MNELHETAILETLQGLFLNCHYLIISWKNHFLKGCPVYGGFCVICSALLCLRKELKMLNLLEVKNNNHAIIHYKRDYISPHLVYSMYCCISLLFKFQWSRPLFLLFFISSFALVWGHPGPDWRFLSILMFLNSYILQYFVR